MGAEVHGGAGDHLRESIVAMLHGFLRVGRFCSIFSAVPVGEFRDAEDAAWNGRRGASGSTEHMQASETSAAIGGLSEQECNEVPQLFTPTEPSLRGRPASS